jgi:dienelactone hydrolase
MLAMVRWLSASVLLLAGPIAGSPAKDPVFDVKALTATPLHSKTLKRTEKEGIVTEEVRFHSERDGDKDVTIFAYFSYPKGGRKLPAYVWNPGGLSQASPAYTEAGAGRGYATLCIDFPQPGYRSTGGYPINEGLELGNDPHRAPIYHGAVALLKAVSYLESRLEVDKEWIGMAGSSWGGFFTTLMVGVDPRLKVGVCLYGTGNLQIGNAWWDGQSRNGRKPPTPAERERWQKTLDPAWRLPNSKTPIAWITGTNDGFYLLPSVMRSYEMAAGPKHLTLVPNWDHALPAKLHDEQFFVWLDAYLKRKKKFLEPSPIQVKKEGNRLIARWEFKGEAKVAQAADLIASYGNAGNWRGRYWHTLKAQIEGQKCWAELPATTLPCYISAAVSDRNGHRFSTPLLRVDPGALGVKASVPVPDYDGCAEWGGFEDSHLAFLQRHDRSGQKRWVPRRSTDAKEGKYSAVLNPGRTILPPILSTAKVPHRFCCFLKAERAVEVTVQLASEQKRFKVGMEWTEVHMDLTPPDTLMGDFPASVTIPTDAKVLIDAVSFRPVFAKDRGQESRVRSQQSEIRCRPLTPDSCSQCGGPSGES